MGAVVDVPSASLVLALSMAGRCGIVTRYVALLRGVNVGGRTKVVMDDVRHIFAELGHTDIETYLQSGNVIFRCSEANLSRGAADIEERIVRELGVTTTVLLRTADELAAIVAANPLLDRESDFTKLHVAFLADEPKPERSARLATPAGLPDELAIVGREVYLHCPNGYGKTKLHNAFIERRLGVAATTRNWKTVTNLHRLASE